MNEQNKLNKLATAIEQIIESLGRAQDYQNLALGKIPSDLPEELDNRFRKAIEEARQANDQILRWFKQLELAIHKKVLMEYGENRARQDYSRSSSRLGNQDTTGSARQMMYSANTMPRQSHNAGIGNLQRRSHPIRGSGPIRVVTDNTMERRREPSAQRQNIPSYSVQETDPSIQMLCRGYNYAIENSQGRNEFMKRYNPIRFGTINTMKRRREPSIEPVFQTANDGNYYAIAIDGKNCYLVVPRFDLTFQESSYGLGAMGQVFDCPNYDPKLRYRNMKMMKPALFEPDSAKRRWVLKEKGKLDLGRGE